MPRNSDNAPVFLPRDEDRPSASHACSNVPARDRSCQYSLPARSAFFSLARAVRDISRTPSFLKDRETVRPPRPLRPNTIAQFLCIRGLWLKRQTVILGESVASKVRFKTADRSSVRDLISGSGKNVQPDRVEL